MRRSNKGIHQSQMMKTKKGNEETEKSETTRMKFESKRLKEGK